MLSSASVKVCFEKDKVSEATHAFRLGGFFMASCTIIYPRYPRAQSLSASLPSSLKPFLQLAAKGLEFSNTYFHVS